MKRFLQKFWFKLMSHFIPQIVLRILILMPMVFIYYGYRGIKDERVFDIRYIKNAMEISNDTAKKIEEKQILEVK